MCVRAYIMYNVEASYDIMIMYVCARLWSGMYPTGVRYDRLLYLR